MLIVYTWTGILHCEVHSAAISSGGGRGDGAQRREQHVRGGAGEDGGSGVGHRQGYGEC